jgi:fatty-acyl-CoA synthase
VRKGCAAAVRVERDTDGAFAVVTETTGVPSPELVKDIRGVVMRTFSAMPTEVVFVPKGTIPKTSSGKICRAVIRRGLADGSLRVRAQPAWLSRLKLSARIALHWGQNRLLRR